MGSIRNFNCQGSIFPISLFSEFHRKKKKRFKIIQFQGFPEIGSVVKNLPGKAGDTGEAGLMPGLVRSPGERKCQPIPVFLPGESPGQRSLGDYSPWGRKRVGHNWTEVITNKQTSNCLTLLSSLISGVTPSTCIAASADAKLSGRVWPGLHAPPLAARTGTACTLVMVSQAGRGGLEPQHTDVTTARWWTSAEPGGVDGMSVGPPESQAIREETCWESLGSQGPGSETSSWRDAGHMWPILASSPMH